MQTEIGFGLLCLWLCDFFLFFFFKQKTAYEIGTGDWSSDVCSSDLRVDLFRSRLEGATSAAGMSKSQLARATGVDRSTKIGRASCRERV